MSAQDGPLRGWRGLGRRVRNEWRPWLTSRTGVGVLAVIAAAALVLTALPSAKRLPPAEPTGTATPTLGPSASPVATFPPDGVWGDLALPEWEPVADLVPEDADASGVSIASAFILTSRTAVPAADLAAGLTAEPAMAFRVQPGASPAEARLVPTAPLPRDVLYRFRLADPTGALAGSWTYRTERPLHVVGTVPSDQTTDVPIDTGIEIEFDQDGVTDISAQFSIDPKVAGRFEAHGRSIVFAPDRPLDASTMYRVTVAAGVAMTGSDQVLEEPASFAFETAGPAVGLWDVSLGRPILEAAIGERPIIALDVLDVHGSPSSEVKSLPFQVYRLPSFDAASAAAAVLANQAGWAQWAASGLVPTEGLNRVAAFDGTFESTAPSGYRVVRFPAPLAAGWYLVVVAREGRDRQALLQVTDLTAFALTSETRTLAWVNDRATGAAVSGAVLSGPGGAVVGQTGTDGLLDVATPAWLLPDKGVYGAAPTTLVSVRAPDGRRLLLPLGLQSNSYAYNIERSGGSQAAEPNHRWWLLLSTDRTTYRSTDTVHAWGLIRSRDDGTVPAGLEVTLRAAEASSEDGPWLARMAPKTTARGAWATDIALEDLPLGSYVFELHAEGIVARSGGIEVAEIRKPAYAIDVETDRRAAIAGDPVTITARAVFFDGTSAAGLDLRVEAFGESEVLTADAEGRVTLTIPARAEGDGLTNAGIGVAPASPEEGQISGSSDFPVVPAAVWLKGSGEVRDGRVVVGGTLSRVDLERVERDLALGNWPEDPAGEPIVGGAVTIRIVENVPAQKRVGSTYDYIEKRVVPVYEYSYDSRPVGTYAARTGAGGTISFSTPVANGDHSYEITISARDAAGRTGSTTLYAAPVDVTQADRGLGRPYLGQPAGCWYYSEEHAAGDTLSLAVHDGDGALSANGRYLFVVASRGIRDAVLQEAGTLTRTYRETDLPSLNVVAVRFLNGTYLVTNQVLIRTREAERTLGVTLTADRSRYAPGDRATVTVTTTDADGSPVAADVVVRGVDEKLFRIGYAFDINALALILSPTGDGLLQSYASHPVPLPDSGYGCGDTTGGRDDFRDSVVFKLLSTGADGRASVSFDLPDDLTSWHISATAVAGDVRAGSGLVLIPVGLPFFADAILASEYLAGEAPVLQVRSFGDGLNAGDRVRFTVSAPSLLAVPASVDAAAFATAGITLPGLSPGVHEVTIKATVIGDRTRTDTLVRKIVVRSSRLAIATTEATTPAAAAGVGGTGLTTYVVTDAGRGSLVPRLQGLAYGAGARFDRLLAADIARDLLIGTFGFDAAALPPGGFDPAPYQRGGVALLPYSSADLALTAMTAIVAPERIDAPYARMALTEWRTDASATGEREVIALAGLAGLGDDVLEDLRAVDLASATEREALWLALGLVASGDEDGARAIERALLEQHGQELGPWVRLDVGGQLATTMEATAMLALVATAIGDPLAPRMDQYVREMQTSEALFVLPEIGVLRWSLDRMPRAAARFAWTVNGQRRTETLEPGASWSTALTEQQRAGFRLETLAGELAVIASWTRTPGPGDLPSGGLVTISRMVTPTGDAARTGLVKVKLRVVFDPKAPTGWWEITDRTPSGLAPVVSVAGWPDDPDLPRTIFAPWGVAGQRVSWSLEPGKVRDFTLAYSARVISPGTFTWEPAVVQSIAAPGVGATTPVTSYTIR